MAAQVDQALGAGQAQLHRLHQALAAGQVAGVGPWVAPTAASTDAGR
jgi:hypothetical protein